MTVKQLDHLAVFFFLSNMKASNFNCKRNEQLLLSKFRKYLLECAA